MPGETATLTCPKCGGEMRTYERNSVHIDQCADCRGIFLDRGELDRLIDAESEFYQSRQQAPPAQVTPPGYSQQPYGEPSYGYRHHDDDDDHHRGYHGGYRKKRRGGFLEELFD